MVQEGEQVEKTAQDEERASKNVYHLVNPKSREGQLAVTWFRKRWAGALFFMGFQKTFAELAQKPLGGEATKVLLLILGELDYGNRVKTPQVEMARKLGIRKQNVSRAIKVLVREKVLLEEKLNDKSKRELKLNPIYAWKGKLKHLGLQPKDSTEKDEPLKGRAKS